MQLELMRRFIFIALLIANTFVASAQTVNWFNTELQQMQNLEMGKANEQLLEVLRLAQNQKPLNSSQENLFNAVMESYQNEKDITRRLSYLEDFATALGTDHILEGLNFPERPTQIPSLVVDMERMLDAFKNYDFRSLSTMDLKKLKELWDILSTANATIQDAIKKVIPKVEAKPNPALGTISLVIDAGKGPLGVVDLGREVLGKLRNHLGIYALPIVDEYFGKAGVPIYPLDFNHFAYAQLILKLQLLRCLESRTGQEDLKSQLIADIHEGLALNLRQIAGMRIAKLPDAFPMALTDGIAGELFKLNSSEAILNSYIQQVSTHLEKDNVMVLEQLNGLEDMLEAAKAGRVTKPNWLDHVSLKAASATSAKEHFDLIIAFSQLERDASRVEKGLLWGTKQFVGLCSLPGLACRSGGEMLTSLVPRWLRSTSTTMGSQSSIHESCGRLLLQVHSLKQ